MAHLGQSYSFRILNKNSSGALANGTVTALLLRNGVATEESVDVDNQSTGRYLISATIPAGWTLEDIAQLEVTVDGVPSLIWGEKVVARPATTDQATTLTNRITGTIRTAADDVTAETAQTTAIRNGLATAANVDDAETAVLAAIDGIGSSALTPTQAAQLTAIKAKTDLITSQNANQQRTPVTTLRIVRGDTFSGTVTVTTDYTGKTGTFTIRHRITGAVLLTSTDVTVNSATELQIDLSYSDTAFASLTQDAEFGPHPYDIEMMGGGEIKTEQGVAILVKDVTIE